MFSTWDLFFFLFISEWTTYNPMSNTTQQLVSGTEWEWCSRLKESVSHYVLIHLRWIALRDIRSYGDVSEHSLVDKDQPKGWWEVVTWPDQDRDVIGLLQIHSFFFFRTVRELSFPIFFFKFLNGENLGGMQSKHIYKCFIEYKF